MASASTPRPTPDPTEDSSDGGLATGAIIMIVVGVYIVVMAIVLLVRQCLKSQGISFCPDWVTEQCCGSCGGDEGERCCLCACFVALAETCDCSPPSKKSCLDSVCPSKKWCDDTFCCCMNAEPGGEICQDCQGPECGCGDCNCACNCAPPECDSINCVCFKIDLGNGSQQPPSHLQQQQFMMQQQFQQQQQQFPQQQFPQQQFPQQIPR